MIARSALMIARCALNIARLSLARRAEISIFCLKNPLPSSRSISPKPLKHLRFSDAQF
jgi:hypothetical protein